MRARRAFSLFRLGLMLACVAVLAACTHGGQFDPTVLLDNNMFNTKTRLKGQREPVFPNGVPGATSGIPADLYKGYQPPPDESATGGALPITPPVAEAAKPAERPKPKARPRPKPKMARAPERPRTRISVGFARKPKPAVRQQAGPVQTEWPAPPPTTAQAPSQTVWPAPPSTASAQSQTAWPAPPPTGGSQQAAQPSQSIWPSPPPTNNLH
jgi:outer membrane biosynthesis protein TonB